MHKFENITLLVTHYNRSNSLHTLLKNFKDLDCDFDEIIVSDDGSKEEHINNIKELQEAYSFKLVQSPVNKGLGNNINKGQDEVTSPYILYVQEDFKPLPPFVEKLKFAAQILNSKQDLDVIRFYAYSKYPYLKDFSDGFSEMIFSQSPYYSSYNKFYSYSDHPHLKRRSFPEKFGRYAENLNPEATEFKMMMSFLLNKGKGLFYTNFNELFEQKNSAAEPSTLKRNFWRKSDNFVIHLLRHLYRHLRFNMELLFYRIKGRM